MSFLEKKTVPISFTGGLQSKTDDLQSQPPSLLSLQNANFNKVGQLNKRFGNDIKSTNVMGGGTINSAAAIDVFNNELNLFDNENVYTFIESNNSWASRGSAISVINTNHQIIRTSVAQQLNPDSTFLNNIEVYLWEDSRGGIRYSVLDHNTQAYVVADKVLPGATAKPKTIAFNNTIYLFYTDANNLFYRTINTNNPYVLSNEVNLATNGYPDFSFDVHATTTNIFIVFQKQQLPSIQAEIEVLVLDTSNAIIASFSVATARDAINDINYSAIAITVDSNAVCWIVWSNSISLYYSSWDVTSPGSPVLITGPTIIKTAVIPNITIIESNTIGVLKVLYQNYTLQTYNAFVSSLIINSAGVVTDNADIKSVGLASKCFRYLKNIYVNLVHDSALQATYFMANVKDMNFDIVGKVNASVSGGLTTNRMLAEVSEPTTGVFLYPNLVKGQFISEDNTNFSLLGVNSTKIDFTNVNKFNSLTQSNNLLFVGGILQSYDGVSVVEQNFHVYPENVAAAARPNYGTLSIGQYQYQVVYAWTDKFGQIQYSSPSPIETITTSTITSSATIEVPTLRLTSKENVVIKIYRTQVNGIIFQEVTSELAPLLNDKTVDSVTFTDTAADNQIAANATIYTTGGVLPNIAPPSCSLITFYKDRVVLSGLEDENSIWFSKNKFNNSNFNTIPVEFSDQLNISISQIGGPITALGLMDDKLIIFKKNTIFVMTGDGPNDLGAGDQFSSPEIVTQSIGCSNPNSVILTKDGIMFQSDKGIWLLDRGLGAPQYIGSGVDDLAKNHTISSATIDPNDNLIIFTTFDGPALVYDYYIQQWSTYTNHEAVDSVSFNNLFTYCNELGQVSIQNRDSYLDGTRFIPLEIETPWLSFGGMQGYQRVFSVDLLGQYRSPHKLDIEVGYDFNPAYTQFATLDPFTTAGSNTWGISTPWGSDPVWGGNWYPYLYQINFKTQRCTTLRLKLKDIQYTPTYDVRETPVAYPNTYEGMTFNNLSFECGVFGNNVRIPKTNKVGTNTP